ncbi:hypothetical protein GCM10017600_20920 [Streptosporangium carneum]|uniref:Uncharacterized protein n=1 Tax=Streptosporangium carneum TaxID=47481 RepID=A0A9W6HYJ1_9ACTN|nr:hypothetical protein GCM10017600_20920 [Streptosporangium carneum]
MITAGVLITVGANTTDVSGVVDTTLCTSAPGILRSTKNLPVPVNWPENWYAVARPENAP